MFRRCNEGPLIGRDHEIAAADKALSVPGAMVIITGPIGIGKTRLTRVISRRAEQRGFVVLRLATGVGLAALPFHAFGDIVWARADEPVSRRLEAVARVRDAVRERAAGRPFVLCVDDAHNLDDESAALVKYLAVCEGAAVVLAIRSDHAPPVSLDGLLNDPDAARIKLGPLARAAFDELVATVLDGRVDFYATERLWQLSGGNPLALLEAILSARDEGSLRRHDGQWTLVGPFVPSQGLREAVLGRLRRFTPATRAVLEVVAIAEPLEVPLLESVCDPAALAAAERDELVVECVAAQRTTVHLAHPLYGEVLRATAPPAGQRAIRKALAASLERMGSRRKNDVLRVVVWRTDAGAQVPPDLLLAAAEAARAGYDYLTAGRLALKAVALGAGIKAQIVTAQCLHALGRAQEAEELLAELAVNPSSDEERTRIALNRAKVLMYGRASTDDAIALLADAQAEVANPSLRAELVALSAEASLHGRRLPDEVIRQAREVLEPPEAANDVVLQGIVVLVPALAIQGRFDDAIAAAAYARVVARHADSSVAPRHVNLTSLTSGIAYILAGRAAGYHELAMEFYQEAVTARSDELRGMWALGLGSVELFSGRAQAAVSHLTEAASLIRLYPAGLGEYGLVWCLGELATAQVLAGDLGAGASTLASAESLRAAVPATPQIVTARVWVAVARGEISRGRAMALDGARQAASLDWLTFEAQLLHAAIRLGARAEACARMEELRLRVGGPLLDAYAAHAQALNSRDVNSFRAAAAGFEQVRAPLLAAECWADVSVAHRRVGQPGPALSASANAKRLLTSCGAFETPALRRLSATWVLTQREEEVTSMVREGLSNQDIADRLRLSVRTVESHRRNAYHKLNIRSARELRSPQ